MEQVASRKGESPLRGLSWITWRGVSARPISALHSSVEKNHTVHINLYVHTQLLYWHTDWARDDLDVS